MAKLRAPVPHVRKSVLIFGGVALAVAVLGFVLVTVVGGGGDGASVAAPSASPGVTRPQTTAPSNGAAKLREGGTNPFRPLVVAAAAGAAAPAPAPTAAPEQPAQSEALLIEVLKVDATTADIRVDSNLHEGVKAGAQLSGGFVLEAISGDCAYLAKSPERFRVCEGERFLK